MKKEVEQNYFKRKDENDSNNFKSNFTFRQNAFFFNILCIKTTTKTRLIIIKKAKVEIILPCAVR